jgi:isoquinoline 1-oxidoreductase beta subunit
VSDTTNISRRAFLVGTAALGGGLILGFHLPPGGRPAAAVEGGDGDAEVNAWIVIHADDTVVIRVARSEMGQGIFTALPVLAAEELECDWDRVRAEYASAHENLVRGGVYVSMSTGGSRSVRQSQEYLRKAGAAAREMLVSAAARRWGVPASECRAQSGIITHVPTGRTLRYGQVASEAARLAPPEEVRLKPREEWRLIGRPVKRLDTREKVTGKPVFGTDVQVPGMPHAAIRACPVFGGRLKAYNAAAVEGRAGVRQVVALEDAVAAVADTYWQAQKAVDALPVDWAEGPGAGVSSEEIVASLLKGLDGGDAAIAHWSVDVDRAFEGAAQLVEAEYYAPQSGPCHDGTHELHRPRDGGPGGDLGAHPERRGQPGCSGGGRRRQPRGGIRAQHFPRRWLRASRRLSGLRAPSRAHWQGGGQTGQPRNGSWTGCSVGHICHLARHNDE